MIYTSRIGLRRGNTDQNNEYIGAKGELTANTDVYGEVRLHDGVTSGGQKMNITDAQFVPVFFKWLLGPNWLNYENKSEK